MIESWLNSCCNSSMDLLNRGNVTEDESCLDSSRERELASRSSVTISLSLIQELFISSFSPVDYNFVQPFIVRYVRHRRQLFLLLFQNSICIPLLSFPLWLYHNSWGVRQSDIQLTSRFLFWRFASTCFFSRSHSPDRVQVTARKGLVISFTSS